MSCEPIPRQDVWQGSDPWGYILELGPQEPRGLRSMPDAIVALSPHDHLVAGLLQELAPPALPAEGCRSALLGLTRPPVRPRQGPHQPGQQDVHAPRACGVLGGMLHTPRRLALLQTAMLDQTALIVVVERLPGLLHRRMGQEDRVAPWPIRTSVPWADDRGKGATGQGFCRYQNLSNNHPKV
jgi:hypothetical protein